MVNESHFSVCVIYYGHWDSRKRLSLSQPACEPAAIPEDEIYGNVLHKTLAMKRYSVKNYDWNLLAPDFYLIDVVHHYNREEVIANHQPLLNNFDSFRHH